MGAENGLFVRGGDRAGGHEAPLKYFYLSAADGRYFLNLNGSHLGVRLGSPLDALYHGPHRSRRGQVRD